MSKCEFEITNPLFNDPNFSQNPDYSAIANKSLKSIIGFPYVAARKWFFLEIFDKIFDFFH